MLLILFYCHKSGHRKARKEAIAMKPIAPPRGDPRFEKLKSMCLACCNEKVALATQVRNGSLSLSYRFFMIEYD